MIRNIAKYIYDAVNEAFDFNQDNNDSDQSLHLNKVARTSMILDAIGQDNIIRSRYLDNPQFLADGDTLYITGSITINTATDEVMNGAYFLWDLYKLQKFGINKVVVKDDNADKTNASIEAAKIPADFIIDTNAACLNIGCDGNTLINNCELSAQNFKFYGYNESVTLSNVKLTCTDNNIERRYIEFYKLSNFSITSNCQLNCANIFISEPMSKLVDKAAKLRIAAMDNEQLLAHTLKRYKKDTEFIRQDINVLKTFNLPLSAFKDDLKRIFITYYQSSKSAPFKGIILYNSAISYVPNVFKKANYTFLYANDWVARDNTTHNFKQLEEETQWK